MLLLFLCGSRIDPKRRRRDIAEFRVNRAIRAREVRVVAPDGAQIGIKKLEEALWLAEQLELDLVEVAPNARPPVCRLMDYGRFKYEQSVRDREARKKQTKTVIKEIRMSPRIGDHDYQMLMRRARGFMEDGDKVKVTIRFRGRENERPELGHQLVERLIEDLDGLANLEQAPEKMGRQMTSVLAPDQSVLRALREAREHESTDDASED